VPLPNGANNFNGISADPNGQIRAVGGNQTTINDPWHPLFERYDLTGKQGGPGWVSPSIDTNQQGILESVSSVATNPNFPWITDVWAVGAVGGDINNQIALA
jgi:hypothetical protein